MNKIYLLRERNLKKKLSNKSLENILKEKELQFEDLVILKTKKNKELNLKKIIKKIKLVKWLAFPTVDSVRAFLKLLKENKELKKIVEKKEFKILAKELVVGIYLKKHGFTSDLIPLKPASFMIGEILPWREDEILLFDSRYWKELFAKETCDLTISVVPKKVKENFKAKAAIVLATDKLLLEALFETNKVRKDTVIYCLTAYVAEICWENNHENVEIPDEYTERELTNRLISN